MRASLAIFGLSFVRQRDTDAVAADSPVSCLCSYQRRSAHGSAASARPVVASRYHDDVVSWESATPSPLHVDVASAQTCQHYDETLQIKIFMHVGDENNKRLRFSTHISRKTWYKVLSISKYQSPLAFTTLHV